MPQTCRGGACPARPTLRHNRRRSKRGENAVTPLQPSLLTVFSRSIAASGKGVVV